MMEHVTTNTRVLLALIKSNTLQWGGHKKLKVYGLLSCTSGKRMKKVNRVFFETEEEAIQLGYRPCGNCLQTQYRDWKNNI